MRQLSGRFVRRAEERKGLGRRVGRRGLREEGAGVDEGDHGRIWEIGIGIWHRVMSS